MNYMLYYVLIFNVDFKIKLLIMFINMNNKRFGDNLYCIHFLKTIVAIGKTALILMLYCVYKCM